MVYKALVLTAQSPQDYLTQLAKRDQKPKTWEDYFHIVGESWVCNKHNISFHGLCAGKAPVGYHTSPWGMGSQTFCNHCFKLDTYCSGCNK